MFVVRNPPFWTRHVETINLYKVGTVLLHVKDLLGHCSIKIIKSSMALHAL